MRPRNWYLVADPHNTAIYIVHGKAAAMQYGHPFMRRKTEQAAEEAACWINYSAYIPRRIINTRT